MPDTYTPEPHVTVTATITDRWGHHETVYAGAQPVWAWEIDRCAAWRKMMRRTLLEDRTADPRGWRVDFTAEPEPNDDPATPLEGSLTDA